MKKSIVVTLLFWGTLLALPAAAQTNAGPATAASTAVPGETVFLSIYIRDGGYYRATFDTDAKPVGGLSTKELDSKFDQAPSLARILNFMRQNGYHVVSFAPNPDGTLNGTGRSPRQYLFVFEHVGPQP